MKERPILFNAPMVRAILDGTKTQTRRIVKAKHLPFMEKLLGGLLDGKWNQRPMPYGQPGDRLWVKETWRPFTAASPWDLDITYAADGAGRTIHDGEFGERDWTMPKAAARGNVSPLFMPRWASRITLEITGVRVERLQDISEADAIAEGMRPERGQLGDEDVMVGIITNRLKVPAPVARYALLWDEINGNMPNNWNSNPWVWVIEFKVNK